MFSHILLKGKTLLSFMVLSVFIMISGCASDHGGTEVGNPESTSPYGIPDEMTTFTDGKELAAYLKEQYAGNVDGYTGYSYMVDVGRDVSIPSEVSNVDSGSRSDHYSETNIQEQGVDESDKVKTDGDYLYVAGPDSVSIVQAKPADDMEIVSTIDVRGRVDSLYLANDLLIILFLPGNGNGRYVTYDFIGPAEGLMPYYIPVQTRTGIMIVDVENPVAPETVKEMRADGTLISSRLTGGKLHVVQQFYPTLPPLQFVYNANEENIEDVIAANRKVLASLTVDDLLPSYRVLDENGKVTATGLLVAPDRFYIPDKPCGGSMTTILTFDIENPSVPYQSVGVVADAHSIYASKHSLYLTATQYTHTLQAENNVTYHYQTVIHKFDLGGEELSWAGSGGVKGKIVNQFSLGEYQDVLRIATTTGDSWSMISPSMNHVFCLETVAQKLKVIGRLENLAPGESIYAARFIGSRGFLVTFVKIDPLFTLDLSDPTEPKVVGKLKVPGYSDYIHPFGENYLMTIGKDVKLQQGTAWYQGVQLSIFDISNFADPVRLSSITIGDRGTDSEALRNHKAFNFWEKKGLLAVPIDLARFQDGPENPWEWAPHVFSGLYVYRVSVEHGFEFIGRIESADTPDPYYYNTWLRGRFIDDHVYAVEADAVHSADVNNFSSDTIRTLPLEPLE